MKNAGLVEMGVPMSISTNGISSIHGSTQRILRNCQSFDIDQDTGTEGCALLTTQMLSMRGLENISAMSS